MPNAFLLPRRVAIIVLVLTVVSPQTLKFTEASEEGFDVQAHDTSLIITQQAKPVVEFVFRDDRILRPYFSNVHIDGARVTRNHPPNPAADAVDHDTMHPGLWLGFGDINQEDFWRNKGRIEHLRFSKEPEVKGGVVSFAEESQLVTTGGEKLAELHSSYQLNPRAEGFLLTWDAEIRASEKDLVFGDQEEMGLGARLATPLTEKAGGQITNSLGQTSAADTWGKQAEWTDYSGKIGNRVVGITIIPSQQNANACWWHNRDYGVFVANPFGKRAGHTDGKMIVKRGQSLRLKFHVLFHSGLMMPNLKAISYELAK